MLNFFKLLSIGTSSMRFNERQNKTELESTPPPVTSNREELFDVIKGIAILLMVLGHSLPDSGIGIYIRNFIYSFHMPLFFIVSGIFYKQKPLIVQIRKDFKTLIIPYLFTACLLVLSGLFRDFYGESMTFPRETVRWFKICLDGNHSGFIGPIWFLLALFWCRMFFSFMVSVSERKNVVWFIIFPMIISYIFKFVNINIFILQGFIALIFYYTGYYIKKNDLLNKKYSALAIIFMIFVWVDCILYSHISMSTGYYDNFIINVIGAVSGFYFVYIFSKIIVNKTLIFGKLMASIGKYSLVILCFHSLDYSIEPFSILIPKIQSTTSLMQGHFYRYLIGMRFAYTFVALFIILKMKIFNKIFSIK